MKTVLINKDGYLRSMYFPEANISIEFLNYDYLLKNFRHPASALSIFDAT